MLLNSPLYSVCDFTHNKLDMLLLNTRETGSIRTFSTYTQFLSLNLIVPRGHRELESGRAKCPEAVRRGDYKVELKFSGAEPQLEVFG